MAALDVLAKQARRVAAGMFDESPSPCVSICRMDEKVEFCNGCMRTLDEIAAWGRMAEEEKRVVWKAIGDRILRQAEDNRDSP